MIDFSLGCKSNSFVLSRTVTESFRLNIGFGSSDVGLGFDAFCSGDDTEGGVVSISKIGNVLDALETILGMMIIFLIIVPLTDEYH